MDEETQLDYLMNNKIDEAEEAELFHSLSRIPGIDDYLKKTLAKDMQRFFQASSDSHQVIRGAYMRTEYLLKKILESREKEKIKKGQEKLDKK